MATYKSKKPTKDGRQYFFRIKYKDIFGETHDYTSPKYKNKKEAIEEEALYRANHKQEKQAISCITIEEIYSEFYLKKSKEVKKQSLSKINDLYKHLEPIKKYKINELSLSKYKQFRNYIEEQNYSVKHSNKILGLLKTLIQYSSKYYNTSNDLIKFIEPFKAVNVFKKEMDFYTYEEYQKFKDEIDNYNWLLFFDILYYLGLRCGECQALQFKDINFEKKTISITKTLTSKIKGENWTISTPKTKNSIRVLPLPEIVLNELKTQQFEAKKYKDYSNDWFIFGNTTPFKENTIQNNKNKYCDKAGLKRIRIHDFRHSCASFLINYCHATISLVSKYLGHSNVSITLNTYTHMYQSELEDITKIINNL